MLFNPTFGIKFECASDLSDEGCITFATKLHLVLNKGFRIFVIISKSIAGYLKGHSITNPSIFYWWNHFLKCKFLIFRQKFKLKYIMITHMVCQYAGVDYNWHSYCKYNIGNPRVVSKPSSKQTIPKECSIYGKAKGL